MRPVWWQMYLPRSDVSSAPALSCIPECRAPPCTCLASSLPYRCTGSETWEGNNGNARRLIAWGIACHGHALSFKWWARASRADPLYPGCLPRQDQEQFIILLSSLPFTEAYIILSESWLAQWVEGKFPLNRSYRQRFFLPSLWSCAGRAVGALTQSFRRCRERTMSGVSYRKQPIPLRTCKSSLYLICVTNIEIQLVVSKFKTRAIKTE